MDDLKIKWSNELLIGNELIDVQHKKLVELVSNIPEFSSSSDENLLSEALQYAAKHFGAEETYLKKINYPGLTAQQNSHKKAFRIILSYEKNYRAGKTDLYSFKQFMFNWVRDHIMNEDKQIAAFINTDSKK